MASQAKKYHGYARGHWLEYDPIAFVVLLIGLGAVALLALSI
jgi:hypothetical protein